MPIDKNARVSVSSFYIRSVVAAIAEFGTAPLIQKKSVLFVGSFKNAGIDGSVGGQMYACRSLLDSSLGGRYNWLLLDSTANSNIPEIFLIRLARALRRLARFLMFITTKRVDCCIIFTADGWSFVEKGTMVVIGKMARKAVILAPRSGLVINDVKRSRFMKTVIVTSIRASDYVICQGKNWSNFYQSVSGEPEEKFKVIPNWIAVDKYAPADQDRRDGKVRILYLSWVEKNKGIFDLVTVAEQLVRVEPNVLFLVAGSGAAIQELRDSIADKGLEKNFELLGWVQGVGKQNLLCSSDIFVLPSYFEGYPNALVEAMASGLPVLATKVGSITEIVKHNRNGMLFNSGDTKMFESMLRQVVSDRDLRRRLGKNARATILRNNSLESAVENFTNIIEDAIGNPQC